MNVDIRTPSSKGLEEAIDSLGVTAIGIADELAQCRHQLRIAKDALTGGRNPLDAVVALMQADGIPYNSAIRAFRRLYLLRILDRHRGNQCKAAAEMGIHRNTIRRMMTELQISAIAKDGAA